MRSPLRQTVFGLLVSLSGTFLLGCQDERRGGAILIVLDTVRADHLSVYGYDRPTTPHLEKLGQEGVVFDQALSYASWTLPSVASMLASGPPSSVLHQGRLNRSVVDAIRDAGYRTAAFTEGGFVSKTFGFDRGFEHWREVEGAVHLTQSGSPNDVPGDGGIENTFALAREWLEENGDEPFFLLIHTYEPHTPYTRTTFTEGLDRGELPETFSMEDLRRVQSGELVLGETERRYLTALYDGGLKKADEAVGELLLDLERLGLEDTIVVVTSDHGEELGEHYPRYAANHGHSLHDPLVHVPLIIRDPKAETQARISEQVRTLDVLPTIADLLGAKPLFDAAGESLGPWLHGGVRQDRIAYGSGTRFGPPRAYLRHAGLDMKYIEVLGPENPKTPLEPPPPERALYDLGSDPFERENIAGEKPKLAEQLSKMVGQSLVKRSAQTSIEIPANATPELIERLRSLGYIEVQDK
ncbi:MAG: sulfatase [Planctomycetota bacterium]